MALWPFRRKSRKKRTRTSTASELDSSRGRTTDANLPPRSETLPDVPMPNAALTPAQGIKKQRTEPNKLQRRVRTYSFSPGRHDSIIVNRKMSTKAKRPAAAPAPQATVANSSQGIPYSGAERVGRLENGHTALNDDALYRVPTLHNKRDGDHLPRKKSSKKRRKDDQAREAEIKAMSSFVPLRPATEDWAAGRPMKRDSVKVKNGFGFGFKNSAKQWEKYNRSSEISLPAPQSIHSNMSSSDSEHISYEVSAFEALAPRPTLRYTHYKMGTGSEGASPPVRMLSQRQKMLSMPIPESTIRAHKRIDDLANDLSASDLREVMERDQRRRERRRQRDQERMEQRLTRRAEKQRAADAEAVRQGRESPPNLERGVLGREVVGLGIDSTSAIVTSSKKRQSSGASDRPGTEQADDHTNATDNEVRPHPLDTFHRTDSIPLETPQSPVEAPEAVPALASPRSKSSFLRHNLSRSKSPQLSEAKTEHSESLRKGSESSSSKGPLSWASFFRWSRNKRNSGGPSSFSNTSRDSMQTPQLPTPPITYVPRRVSSGVPKRTKSRFREDLPEMPISPPDSRIQSPEAEPILPDVAETSPDLGGNSEGMLIDTQDQKARYDTPTSEQRSLEAMRQTPSTFGPPDEPEVSPEPQTLSLASIDSEGSWLSGRVSSKKRKSSGILQSGPYSQLPQRTSESDHEQTYEHGHDQDNTNEDMSITEDDYLSRVARSNSERIGWKRHSTGEPRPSSDGEEEAHWGSVRGHQPTVVHNHTADRMKSREGLLKSYGEEGEHKTSLPAAGEPTGDSDDADEDEVESEGLQRAKSVNLGKGHVRHISAGSARLLSLAPRSSADITRRSVSPKLEKTEPGDA